MSGTAVARDFVEFPSQFNEHWALDPQVLATVTAWCARLDVLAPRRARLVLSEGRYHQVRRMIAAVGNHCDALHRSRIGELVLDGLAPGQWRELTAAELALLG